MGGDDQFIHLVNEAKTRDKVNTQVHVSTHVNSRGHPFGRRDCRRCRAIGKSRGCVFVDIVCAHPSPSAATTTGYRNQQPASSASRSSQLGETANMPRVVNKAHHRRSNGASTPQKNSPIKYVASIRSRLYVERPETNRRSGFLLTMIWARKRLGRKPDKPFMTAR